MKKELVSASAWAILVNGNAGTADNPHLHREGCLPVLYLTRKAAREEADRIYGYIKTRKDLRRAPFNWRMPVAVRVTVAEMVEAPTSRRASA